MQQNQTNMKKLPVIFAILVAAFTFTACEYQNVYPTEYKTVYQNNSKTLDIEVPTTDWKWSDNGYFFVTYDIPDLTQEIYDQGVISCYREYFFGTKDAYQINLPLEYSVSANGMFFRQKVDFSFGVGFIEIAVTNSDSRFNSINPEDMHFRLNMMW